MADSLNSAIQKLGDTISSNLFGNKSNNPVGSTNFSGVYIGPGGGVTRSESFTVEGSRYGSSFAPIGYFDKTNQWIDDRLSTVIDIIPGVTREEFPKTITDGRTNEDLNLSESYNAIGKGFTPPGFFTPNDLWLDIRFSRIIGNIPGINRTSYSYGAKFAPLSSIEDPDIGGLASAGFTPIYYYRTGEEFIIRSKSLNDDEIGVVSFKESYDYTKKTGPDGFYKSKSESDYRFKFGLEDDRILTDESAKGPVTPESNEDPLYTGFEIIIDTTSSPLFNGEAANFISKFSGNKEINSRAQVLNDFIFEAFKFFKFNTPPANLDSSDKIFVTPYVKKMHYLKKVNGINKLIESNTPSQQSSFVKYRNDLLTLSFYEDTTLELGTLMSLYKSLYWSRINGKNVIPENLLRFDCKLIVSEVRNFTRVKRAAETGQIQTLKENVSRYVYDLYECQLFFDKMSHGDSVTMEAMNSPDSSEISMSWKYSTMRFERYDYRSNDGKGLYKHLDNKLLEPQSYSPDTSDNAIITEDGIIPFVNSSLQALNNGYSGKDKVNSFVDSRFEALSSEDLGDEEGDTTVEDLKTNDKINLYAKYFDRVAPEDTSKSAGIYPSSSLNGEDENQISLNKDSNFKKAGNKLLQNIKKAALNEAQRQLNNQFRLVNNSLDKIRSSFGIGRMREPTNVYSNLPNAQFFFDVKNSLRDFGGDVLGGLLGG
jgi:hypothetical protein